MNRKPIALFRLPAVDSKEHSDSVLAYIDNLKMELASSYYVVHIFEADRTKLSIEIISEDKSDDSI